MNRDRAKPEVCFVPDEKNEASRNCGEHKRGRRAIEVASKWDSYHKHHQTPAEQIANARDRLNRELDAIGALIDEALNTESPDTARPERLPTHPLPSATVQLST